MVQISRPWDGVDTGDANGSAPYDAKTEMAEVYMLLAGTDLNASLSGVRDLEVVGGAGLVTVGTGKALVWGTYFESDAVETITIPTPAGSTRVDVIVLRKEWDAQLVRIQRVNGTEGAGIPALTQLAGIEWETPLANVSITTGGVITLTDRREFLVGSIGAGVVNLAFGDVADGGVSGDSAAEDHVHGMPEAYQLLVKSADTSRTAVTLLADTVFVAPVIDTHVYKFSAMLVFTESVAGTDICFDIVAPGGSVVIAHAWGLDVADAFAFRTLVNTDAWGAPGTVFIEGVCDCGADGFLAVHWGAKVNTGGNITLKTLSSFMVASDV